MKRKELLIFIAMITMGGFFSSFDYSKEWKKVEESKIRYPMTALDKINEIEQVAIKEKNLQQQLKCILTRGNVNSFQNDGKEFLSDLRKFREKTDDRLAQAVALYLESMCYARVYDSDYWKIISRTNLSDTIPENMDEWTSNIFKDKIRDLRFKVLSNSELLRVKTTDYEGFVTVVAGANRLCHPTLYDLMVYHCLEGDTRSIFSEEDQVKLLSDLVDFHKNDKEKSAYVAARIELLKLTCQKKKSYWMELDVASYERQLSQMITELDEFPASILARIEYANSLRTNHPISSEKSDVKPQTILDICSEGQAKHPKYFATKSLMSIADFLKNPVVEMTTLNQTFRGGEPIRLKVSYANVNQVKFQIRRVKISPLDFALEDVNSFEPPVKYDKVAEHSFSLEPSNYCVMRDTVLELPSLPYGVYDILLPIGKEIAVTGKFAVTDLASFVSKDEDDTYLFVVDNKNGAPMSDVLVEGHIGAGGSKKEKTLSGKTDKDGLFLHQLNEQVELYNYSAIYSLSKGKDCYANQIFWPRPYAYVYSNKVSEEVSLFTDRAIYRPGQTVRFKCIAYSVEEDSQRVLKNKKLEIVLRDANFSQVSSLSLTTNEFGSASGSFVIPTNCVSGSFSLNCDNVTGRNGGCSFKVEEYKRPSFEVDMKRPEGEYSFGDTVKLTGSAQYLLGTPLTGAKVEYSVIRTSHPFFWWWPSKINEEIVAKGEEKTADDGSYSISFLAEKMGDKDATQCYLYKVNAKVTDANGETHEQSISLALGDKNFSFVAPDMSQIEMDSLKNLEFQVVNLNCVGLQKEVDYLLCCEDKEVAKGKVLSDEKGYFSLNVDTKSWKSSKYKMVLSAKDEKQRESKREFDVILYRSTDNVPPIETDFWTENCTRKELAEGETHLVRVGSSLPDAHLLMVVSDDLSVQKYRWFNLKNQILSFPLSLGEGHVRKVSFFLLHDGKMNSAHIELTKKPVSKDLPMKLSVFRDKMLPGSEEKWTLTLPAERSAEVLAAMYDASLDQIVKHNWDFDPRYRKNFQFTGWSHSWIRNVALYNSGKLSVHFPNLSGDYLTPVEDELQCMESAVVENRIGSGIKKLFRKSKNASPLKIRGVAAQEEDSEMYFAKSEGALPEKEESEVKVRSNFAETAFFYPDLRSDSLGNVNITFTMPESLTRWKFMALAHTADLYTGRMLEYAVTQKSFMVSPNYPRFLRHGDQCVLSAKVVNLSDVPQKGVAKLQLLDPLSEKVLMEKSSDFSLAPKQNGAVKWAVDVPEGVDAVLVRVIGRTADFSDAEQKLLPILSQRTVLTKSMPMYVRGGQTKVFSFDALKNNGSKTLDSKFLKLEMMTNPIWSAVQSLPSMAVVVHKNAISLSSAFFVAKTAELIARSNPKIFSVIELWKQQSGDKETLISNLEKNPEVKNVLLNETPWAMMAKTDTERMQSLGTLFDLNELKSKSDKWLEELLDLQRKDGGFSWFKGMLSSDYTTLFVIDNYCRLKSAGVDVSAQKASIQKAVGYLDRSLADEYKCDVKRDGKPILTPLIVYYFQLRGQLRDIAVGKDCQKAFSSYFELLCKEWGNMDLQTKALAAMAMFEYDKKEEASQVVRSLREYSAKSDEMGMYWPSNKAGYFWYDATVGTHTRIMEALAMVDYQKEEQDELRIWLLNQKRTQHWGNPIANIDALSVLLLNGSDWGSGENVVSVRMGGKSVKPSSSEVGTGYYSLVVPGAEVKPTMGNVELTSNSGGNLSWGALYWCFEEDLNSVEKHKNGLQIEKMVMLESVENGEKVLKSLNGKQRLKVGDKLVVRLTVRTDRTLDFVSLKDQRAACLEPTQQLSGYRWDNQVGYYQSAKDASMFYFFDHLPKGTYVFEYPLYVTHEGDYTNGISTVQCLYAPEFLSNTGSVRIKVGK